MSDTDVRYCTNCGDMSRAIENIENCCGKENGSIEIISERDANNIRGIAKNACCWAATEKECICVVAYECEYHGETHWGTHNY